MVAASAATFFTAGASFGAASTGAVFVSGVGAAALVLSMQLFSKIGRAIKKGRNWCFIRIKGFWNGSAMDFFARIERKEQNVNRVGKFLRLIFHTLSFSPVK
jgi:hypothetical protein